METIDQVIEKLEYRIYYAKGLGLSGKEIRVLLDYLKEKREEDRNKKVLKLHN